MAFGANSKVFTQFINTVLENIAAVNLSTDVPKVALYNDTGTPDQNATAALSAYAAATSPWVVGNEVTDATGWPAGGNALASTTHVAGTGLWTYDAADLASVDAHTTLASVYGCLVYDDTLTTPVADQGICYLSFGGIQSVTAGTFTILFNASGILALTL
jgi:hypothetical protein